MSMIVELGNGTLLVAFQESKYGEGCNDQVSRCVCAVKCCDVMCCDVLWMDSVMSGVVLLTRRRAS